MSDGYDLTSGFLPDDRSTVRDGYDTCLTCGKNLKLKADGTMRTHKCVASDSDTPTEVATVKPRTVRRSRKAMPDQVRRLGVAASTAGIEWTAEKYVTKVTDTSVPMLPSGRKLTELPDPDAMIGPFLNALWPQLPATGQKVITEIAGHEDLIGAVFAWLAYMQQVRAYVDTVTERKADESVSGPIDGRSDVPRTADPEWTTDGVSYGTVSAFSVDT